MVPTCLCAQNALQHAILQEGGLDSKSPIHVGVHHITHQRRGHTDLLSPIRPANNSVRTGLVVHGLGRMPFYWWKYDKRHQQVCIVFSRDQVLWYMVTESDPGWKKRESTGADLALREVFNPFDRGRENRPPAHRQQPFASSEI